jgi:hypothetical protein
MMVRVHATRLMPVGEVALWNEGRIAWRGLLGSLVTGVEFDCVSLNQVDAVKFERLLSGWGPGEVLSAIAGWWCCEDA